MVRTYDVKGTFVCKKEGRTMIKIDGFFNGLSWSLKR